MFETRPETKSSVTLSCKFRTGETYFKLLRPKSPNQYINVFPFTASVGIEDTTKLTLAVKMTRSFHLD